MIHFAAFAILFLSSPADDLDAFKGKWSVTSIEMDGKQLPINATSPVPTFDGDKYTITEGGKVVEKGKLKLNAKAKPKAADFSIEEGSDKGKLQLAIYEIDGDNLKICFSQPGDTTRPPDFTAKEGSNRSVVSFKRVK